MIRDVRKQLEENFDEFIRDNFFIPEPDLSFKDIEGRIKLKRVKYGNNKFFLKVAAAVLFLTVFSISFLSYYRKHAYIKKIDESYVKVMSNISTNTNPFDGRSFLEGLDSSNPFLITKNNFRERGK